MKNDIFNYGAASSKAGDVLTFGANSFAQRTTTNLIILPKAISIKVCVSCMNGLKPAHYLANG